MQENTKPVNQKKKIAPIVVTVLVILYMIPLILMALAMGGLLGAVGGPWGVLPFLIIYIAIGVAVIIGISLAMRQRLREIDGGEEEEAAKY